MVATAADTCASQVGCMRVRRSVTSVCTSMMEPPMHTVTSRFMAKTTGMSLQVNQSKLRNIAVSNAGMARNGHANPA